MSGIFAPDVRNLAVGRGFCLFKADGATSFEHLGNCPKIVYTTGVTVLPHFNVQLGTKVQDLSVILQKGGKMSVTMEERTFGNLQKFFLASSLAHGHTAELAIYGLQNQIQGEFKFIATNDVGPRWYFDLTRVLIAPTGAMEFIDENAYSNFTVEMTHVVDDNLTFGTLTLQPDVSTISPQNILLPFISGSLNEITQPFAPIVGELLTCNLGGWVGLVTVSFQWKGNGTPIPGATTRSYTPVVGDLGHTLTVDVTAFNPQGSTLVTTIATLAVI